MTATERLQLLLSEARKVPLQPWRPRFSCAGDCRRALVYDATEDAAGIRPSFEERPLRWNAAAAAGTAIGEMLEKAASRMGARVQIAAALNGVHGHCDIIWDEDDCVWDIKWGSDYAIRQARGEANPKHVLQVQGYAAALGKKRWALVYGPLGALGKGQDLPTYLHEGETPPEAADAILDVWADVEEHVTNGTLPERGELQATCEAIQCRFRVQCWEGDEP